MAHLLSRWNHLDLLVVIVSTTTIIVENVTTEDIFPMNPSLIRVIRVLRLARSNETES